MNESSPAVVPRHLQVLLVALVACLIGAIVLLGHRYLPLTLSSQQQGESIPYLFPDSKYYIAIAEGKISEVPSPYCRRVLYPWLAEELSKKFQAPLPIAFVSLNFFGFALMSYCLAAILQKLEVNPCWTILALLTPLPLESLQRAYLPDLFHVALLALFFLLIVYQLEKWALVVLMLAFLTRDNTVILSLVVCFTGWWFGRTTLLWGGALVFVTGIVCESFFVHLGQPNRHHLPEIVYTALFVPCSFLGNVLGIVFYTDAGASDGNPIWHWDVPHSLQFGADHVAYLAYDWSRPFETFGALLTLFGCGPLILWYLRKGFGPMREWALAIQIAFTYGVICYFLGTSVGRTGTFRLVGYSWPLFWIALPYFVTRAKLKIRPTEVVLLWALSLLTAWMPNLEGLNGPYRAVTFWLILIPIFYVVTALCLNRIKKRSEPISEI